MFSPDAYRHLADAVLLLHLCVVAFVVGGLGLVFAGAWRGWAWVRRRDFRLAHLAAIVYVAAQSWLGVACPLTVLESWLRVRAGLGGYRRGFIEDAVQGLLYYEAPPWVFVAVYTAFAGAVAAAWRWVPPRRGSSAAERGQR